MGRRILEISYDDATGLGYDAQTVQPIPWAVSGAGNTWTSAAFTAAAVLTGITRYASQEVVGPIAFTVSGTPVAGGTAYYKLTANGVNTPTFTGMVAWGGSAGWVNTAGTINSVAIWYDGDTTYYSVTQNASAPLTQPSFVSAQKTGASAPGTLTITLSAAIANTGGTAPDPAAFSITTTNGGAQTDTVDAATASAGTTVTLTTSRAAVSGDTTTVSYNPALGALAKRLVDSSGNLLFAWSNAPVSVVSFAGMLDGLGATAIGAWSLRRLLSSYTGPLIQITGSVQGTFDVPYLSTTGDLDTTRITGASGETYLLTKVYDQTGGGRDQTVAFTASAPTIARTGGPKSGMPMRILNSGSANIKFVGTSLESVFLTGRQGSQFSVLSGDSTNSFLGGTGGSNAGDLDLWQSQLSTSNSPAPVLKAFVGPSTVLQGSPNPSDSSFRVVSMIVNASNSVTIRAIKSVTGAKNVESTVTGATASSPTSLTKWGFSPKTTGSNNASYLELVNFTTDVGTTIRDVIEDNQRLYWGV